ncbi:MAG TPA: phosphoribosyltransferase, partial [Gammaproteobacteria bacterium]|nr:phosphoribosyltransferase [Gammaproteobacteria bacterium]
CCDIPQQRVLLVDDVNDTGDTLRAAVEHLRERGAAEVRVAVLHDKPGSRFQVDYRGQRIRGWRWLIYPWAVAEDVRGFLARHDGPREPEAARQWLETHFGIRLDLRQLTDILQLARPGDPA